MNPVLKSWLTSVLLSSATALATWGVAHGLVPAADQTSVANAIATAVPTLLIGVFTWWKGRQVTPTAVITQVNKQKNGVKVVPDDAPVDAVDKPLEGPGS